MQGIGRGLRQLAPGEIQCLFQVIAQLLLWAGMATGALRGVQYLQHTVQCLQAATGDGQVTAAPGSQPLPMCNAARQSPAERGSALPNCCLLFWRLIQALDHGARMERPTPLAFILGLQDAKRSQLLDPLGGSDH